MLAAACSNGAKAHPAAAPGPSSTVKESASATRSTRLLAIGSIDLQKVGTKGSISTTTRRAALATAQRYVNDAILAPLETGKVAHDYPNLFIAGIRPAVTGADAPVLTDGVVGRTLSFSETSSPVALSGLADASGALTYLATDFTVKIQATTARGTITITRPVELTLQLFGSSWLVVAYRVTVTRTKPVRKVTKPAPRRTTPTTRRRPAPRTTTTVRTG